MVKLKDIAEKANVSIATVSRALNEDDEINDKTKNKIFEIAKELNYTPDFRGQALVKKSTKIIGVVVPRVDNVFFAEFIQAIKNTVTGKGYNDILYTSNHTTKDQYINVFKSGFVDGLIFSFDEICPKIKNLAKEIPVVFVGVDYPEERMKNIPVITANFQQGSYATTSHLINLGHKNIAYAGPMSKRYYGYKKAMEENSLSIIDNFLIDNVHNMDEFDPEIIKKENITGIISYNDEIAIYLIQLLERSGIKIPADVSMCGVDNIKFSNSSNPPLTTFDIPKTQMGESAGELLLNKLSSNKKIFKNEKRIIHKGKLIVRKSTATLKSSVSV
ncbi:MAG: LacI family DNA-binding transcriptional regulator [archaeon]